MSVLRKGAMAGLRVCCCASLKGVELGPKCVFGAGLLQRKALHLVLHFLITF